MNKLYEELTDMIDAIKHKEEQGLIANSGYVKGYIAAIMDVFRVMSPNENLEQSGDDIRSLSYHFENAYDYVVTYLVNNPT